MSFVTYLITESHWGDVSDFDIEEITTHMLIFYDMKKVVTELDADRQLLPIVDLMPDDLASKLNELNEKIESMRVVDWITKKEDQDTAIKKLSEISFLSEEEIRKLKNAVKIYKFALDKIGDSAEVVCAELNDETLLHCVTNNIAYEYLTLMTKTKRWLNPIEAIVSTRKIEDMEGYNLLARLRLRLTRYAMISIQPNAK